MPTININADQNQDTVVNIADATAVAGEKILFTFLADQVNVFNKATENNGGKENEVVITPGVGYEFTITAADALKLTGTTSNTYKQYKINDEDAPNLKNEGDITVEPLAGGEQPVAKMFSDRKVYRHIQITGDKLSPIDQVLIFHAPELPFSFDLDNPAYYPGKELILHNAGLVTASMNIPDEDPYAIPADETRIAFSDGEEWYFFF